MHGEERKKTYQNSRYGRHKSEAWREEKNCRGFPQDIPGYEQLASGMPRRSAQADAHNSQRGTSPRLRPDHACQSEEGTDQREGEAHVTKGADYQTGRQYASQSHGGRNLRSVQIEGHQRDKVGKTGFCPR